MRILKGRPKEPTDEYRKDVLDELKTLISLAKYNNYEVTKVRLGSSAYRAVAEFITMEEVRKIFGIELEIVQDVEIETKPKETDVPEQE